MKCLLLYVLIWFFLLGPARVVNFGWGAEPRLDLGTPLPLAAHHKDVQKEILLTSEQVAKVKTLYQQVGDKELTEPDIRQKLEKVLQPDQVKRLKEISWQVRDGLALTEQELQESLHITPSQKMEIARIWDEERKELTNALSRVRFKSEEDREAFIAKRLQTAGERLKGLLTLDQQKAFRQLMGKHFELRKGPR